MHWLIAMEESTKFSAQNASKKLYEIYKIMQKSMKEIYFYAGLCWPFKIKLFQCLV